MHIQHIHSHAARTHPAVQFGPLKFKCPPRLAAPQRPVCAVSWFSSCLHTSATWEGLQAGQGLACNIVAYLRLFKPRLNTICQIILFYRIICGNKREFETIQPWARRRLPVQSPNYYHACNVHTEWFCCTWWCAMPVFSANPGSSMSFMDTDAIWCPFSSVIGAPA